MIDKAITFATKAHEGQFRKGTKLPYIVHPLEVGVIVSRMTQDKEVIAAAILHDTLEDCKEVTFSTLCQEFGERVAEIVKAESEEKGGSWNERKANTVKRLKEEKDWLFHGRKLRGRFHWNLFIYIHRVFRLLYREREFRKKLCSRFWIMRRMVLPLKERRKRTDWRF